jgi:hypothetical protein
VLSYTIDQDTGELSATPLAITTLDTTPAALHLTGYAE